MKHRMAVLALALLVIASAFAGSEEPLVTIKPEKPAVGAELTIRYNPAVKGAALFGAEAVDVQVLVLREKEMPLLLEAAMKKNGKVWEAKLKLDDAKSRCGLVRFVSAKVTDANQDRYWDFLIHDQSGKPVQGAHVALSQTYQSPSSPDFRRERSVARAREEAAKEEALYPGQRQTKFQFWSLDMAEKKGDSTLVRSITTELDAMAKASADNDEELLALSSWYRRVGLVEKARAFEEQILTKDPKGKIAKQLRQQRVFQTRDANERVKLMEAFVQDFSALLEPNEKATMASLYINAKQYDKAEAAALALQPPDGNLLNGIAWEYIEKETNVARGVELAKQGVEVLRNSKADTKPAYFSQQQWKKSQLFNLGAVLDTYAFGLFKLGRYPEAQQAYREAYDLTEGADADINERLVQCYLKNGDYAEAVEIAKACIEKSKYNDKLLEYGKEAFMKKEGKADDFDQLVAAAKEKGAAKAKEKLMAERVDKPAVNFSAKNLAGETVQLASLKGKVVVLDFWATWCGPCKAAFPFVQKVYEKYKSNSDVVILAVNTWENEKGAEREKLVKKFMEDNKYTFPVVYDETQVVEKYKVEGIPTQFFIDRKGVIQFKTVGFEGPETEQGMSMKIDLLLSGEQFSAR